MENNIETDLVAAYRATQELRDVMKASGRALPVQFNSSDVRNLDELVRLGLAVSDHGTITRRAGRHQYRLTALGVTEAERTIRRPEHGDG